MTGQKITVWECLSIDLNCYTHYEKVNSVLKMNDEYILYVASLLSCARNLGIL